MKLKKLFFYLSIFLIFAACEEAIEDEFLAKEGLVDFSTHDFTKESSVSLDGQWDFYWNELLTPQQIATGTYQANAIKVPGSWSNTTTPEVALPTFGYATYQLKGKVPSDAPPLVFKTQFIASNCKIYVDDELLMQQGDIGKTADKSSYNSMPIHLELPPMQDSFSITIQVSNFKTTRSGLVYHTFLRDAALATASQKHQIFHGLSFWGGAIFLSILLLGCYFIFALNKSTFYLGLVFLCFGYWRTSSDMKLFNLFFIDFDWEWSIRMEVFSLVLTFFLLGISVKNFYAKYHPKIFTILLQSTQLVFALLILIVPIVWVFTLIYYHLFLIFACLLYISIITIRATKDDGNNIWFVLVALATSIISTTIYVVMDLFYHEGDSISFLLEFIFLSSLLLLVLYRKFSNIVRLGERANAATEAKERFLSVISHEMRTPMNGILVVSDLLEKTPLNEEQQAYITSLRVSGRSLLTLVEDVLDNTRIKEGKLKVQQEVFDISALCQKIVTLFRLLSDKKSIALNLDIAASVPKKGIGDPIRIKQILDNLIGNALKFTTQGRIDLLVSSSSIDTEQFMLKFQVKDTGIGMSKTEQQEIFEQFSQANSDLNRQNTGMGLGLSICKQVVELMGGSISVQSEKGKGTNFSFDVPLIKYEEEIIAVAKPPIESISTPKELQILIVEDNPINLKLLSFGLKKLGYPSDSAVNGRLGVEATEAQDYDLIFMDVQMPEMDGLEATRLIKQNRKKPPYIVVLTANAFPEDEAAAYAAGADDFLAKPFKLNTIEALIRQLEDERLSILSS